MKISVIAFIILSLIILYPILYIFNLFLPSCGNLSPNKNNKLKFFSKKIRPDPLIKDVCNFKIRLKNHISCRL